MNILIVDDDHDDLDIFCEALKEMIPAANCITYESADDALQFLRDSDITLDYIFLDVFMCGIDGKQCLLEIRSIEAVREVPIIMYSGQDNRQGEIYKTLGASAFLTKPSSMGALRQALSSIIQP